MAVTATETGIVQGETKFATWMADLLGGASTRVARTAVDTIEPVGFTSLRLSADSERWLSPSGHAQLRPSGDVPLGTDPDSRSTPGPADKSASAADASLLDTRRLDEFRSVDDSSRSLTREVIGLFLVEAAVTLRDIDIALNTGDGCELARSTHTLKALADNVGASGIVSICRQLETHAARGRLAESREQVWRLHLVWGQTRSVMESWC